VVSGSWDPLCEFVHDGGARHVVRMSYSLPRKFSSGVHPPLCRVKSVIWPCVHNPVNFLGTAVMRLMYVHELCIIKHSLIYVGYKLRACFMYMMF
jgi:hypothetical protein